jgi:hypothetical protein
VQDYQAAMYWRTVTESHTRLGLGKARAPSDNERHEPQPGVWAHLVAQLVRVRTLASAERALSGLRTHDDQKSLDESSLTA